MRPFAWRLLVSGLMVVCFSLRQASGQEEIAEFPVSASKRASVLALAISPDGKTVAAPISAGPGEPSRGDYICLWDVKTKNELGRLYPEKRPLSNFMAFTPDGKSLLSASAGCVDIWDVKDRKVRLSINPLNAACYEVSLAGNGKLLACGTGTVEIFEVATGKMTTTFKLSKGAWKIALSPDGKWFLCSYGNGTTELWDVGSQKILGTVNHSDFSLTASIAFTPDSKRFMTATREMIQLWDRATLKPITEIDLLHPPLHFSPNRIMISPSGESMIGVGAGSDTGIGIWRHTTGEFFTGRRGWTTLSYGAISGDGKILVTGDRTIKIWRFPEEKR